MKLHVWEERLDIHVHEYKTVVNNGSYHKSTYVNDNVMNDKDIE